MLGTHMDPTKLQALPIYLAIGQSSKKWTMPIRNWRMALSRFEIEFGDRLAGHQ